MRFVSVALLLVVSATPALAQREPEIVIPGRTDVAVYINGVNATWGVVEGEFGLFRPGETHAVLVDRPIAISPPFAPPVRHYFPSSGRLPGYGRLEIVPPPNRPKPPPAPTYFRSWSSQSSPNVPVTTYPVYPPSYAPYTSPMINMWPGSPFWPGGRGGGGGVPEPHR
jgi:hypothetical protein